MAFYSEPSFFRTARWRLACAALLAGATATFAAPDPREDRVVRLNPFAVNSSPLGTVGVAFAFIENFDDDGAGPIAAVVVTDVPSNSPGEKAGLRKGDQFLALNGQEIRGLSIAEFAELIRRERAKGDLRWKLIRGVGRVTYTAVFNGRGDRQAHLVAGGESIAPGMNAGAETSPADPAPVERMAPYSVEETVSTGIDVAFVLARQSLFRELDDPIEEAKVVTVQTDHPRRASLQEGDRLIALNGMPIAGLTLRELGARVASQRKQGLVWEVRRNFQTITRRYDGRWIRALPSPAAP